VPFVKIIDDPIVHLRLSVYIRSCCIIDALLCTCKCVSDFKVWVWLNLLNAMHQLDCWERIAWWQDVRIVTVSALLLTLSLCISAVDVDTAGQHLLLVVRVNVCIELLDSHV
jgi:hypothetical protein